MNRVKRTLTSRARAGGFGGGGGGDVLKWTSWNVSNMCMMPAGDLSGVPELVGMHLDVEEDLWVCRGGHAT